MRISRKTAEGRYWRMRAGVTVLMTAAFIAAALSACSGSAGSQAPGNTAGSPAQSADNNKTSQSAQAGKHADISDSAQPKEDAGVSDSSKSSGNPGNPKAGQSSGDTGSAEGTGSSAGSALEAIGIRTYAETDSDGAAASGTEDNSGTSAAASEAKESSGTSGAASGAGTASAQVTTQDGAASASDSESPDTGKSDSANGTDNSGFTASTANSDVPDTSAPEVLNNGGHFVKVGDKVYFHCYGSSAFQDTALWGSFKDQMIPGDDSSAMMTYDPEAGAVETLFPDDGYGGIWVFNDRLYLNRMTDSGSVVYWVNPANGEMLDFAFGKIEGMSADRSHLCYSTTDEQGRFEYVVSGPEELDMTVIDSDDENFAYLGLEGRNLFFLTQNFE